MILKHFDVAEFVPPEIYNELGDASIDLMDKDVLFVAEQLREYFGVMYINTWCFGGLNNLRYRGYRPPTLTSDPITGTKFARRSRHKFGQAIDFHFRDVSIDEARNVIMNRRRLFPQIKRMEMRTPTWIHIDTWDDFYDPLILF